MIIKLVSSPLFWVDILLAISGGIVVWWGLKIEKEAERLLIPSDFKPDIFADVVEPYKAKVERGWRILMTGIVLEVVAAFIISVISGLEIAEANDQAAKANERVAQLEKETTQLATARDEAMKSAAQAVEAAERAKTEREKAETGRLELEKQVLVLGLKMQDRTITPEQRTDLIECLAASPKGKVIVLASVLDGEATRLAEKVENVLTNARYQVDRPTFGSPISILADYNSGMHLVVKDLKNPPIHAVPIQRCFWAAGIQLDVQWPGDREVNSNVVEISIGPKF